MEKRKVASASENGSVQKNGKHPVGFKLRREAEHETSGCSPGSSRADIVKVTALSQIPGSVLSSALNSKGLKVLAVRILMLGLRPMHALEVKNENGILCMHYH